MIANRLIAHRGCAQLAPENTLGAMRLTQRLGIDWVEIDANLVGDGTVVIFHDDELSRLSKDQGRLMSLTYADLAHVDVGSHFSAEYSAERIPTLDEMLVFLSQHQFGLNLEIKRYEHFSAEQIVEPSIRALEQNWQAFDRLIISSFDTEILQLIQQRKPEWPLGQLWEALPDNWQSIAESLGAVSIHLDYSQLTTDQARAIKQAGYDLYVYTVNDPNAAKCLFEMGVDGIFTDNPTLFD
ncbi:MULTISPECIES: glycerophosphodiester phosphodiesterase family protein [Nitrincola]|uniref:Glycerophosphoryl diester phosphodiesterase n=1 Tax=Nitrincola nitratireducens TaxID=1229521 RepID=W9VR53_9GAMM|nr:MULTISPECIES: glycerophosphodiester phosphodiesterase family protein [Nitrincola]EXJ12885.1 Glycerophosphoryl diester phosphodiesterase [Nitrincola nitratireducens]